MRGVADPLEGQESVRSMPGPMAHSPEDLELVMKVYLASEPWQFDPAVLRLPWIPIQEPKRQLCSAIAYGDEVVSPLSEYSPY
jgi:amidase